MSIFKRVKVLSRIAEMDETSPKKCEAQAVAMLVPSPISSIVRGLMYSTLSPSNPSTLREDSGGDQIQDTKKQHKGQEFEDGRGQSNRRDGGGLFKNAFKLRSTPENRIRSRPKARRLLGMASRRFSSPDAPMSPSTDKENNSGVCNSHCVSPQKVVGAKKARFPLEDCDPNSQDSGYEACYPEKEDKDEKVDGFRFAEPLAVAPRRMSIESRSPMASPIRSSPQRSRVARPSLFRSLSSGYESMDDGFNDLVDIESMDDATQLPNGISTLLCGDIVSIDANIDANIDSFSLKIQGSGVPSTPEFSRTSTSGSNFRRSASIQIDRQEGRKSCSSLSKVRSCLFPSPSTSSSTANSSCEESSPLTAISGVPRRRRIAASTSAAKHMAATAIVDSPLSVRTFKRPEPPIDESPKLVKRSRRSSNFLVVEEPRFTSAKVVSLQRSLSESAATTTTTTTTTTTRTATTTTRTATTTTTQMETDEEEMTDADTELESHAHIKSAIHRSTTDADLTGDFSKPCVLPLATGHHEDLKSISAATLAGLIRGEFNDRIGSFKVVDCRYPYEFDAGHIEGALNLYNKDLIERILLEPLTNAPKIQPDTNKRNILVFHCEFSWERGPNLSRFLRNLDRQRNKEHYPALYYPEVYLLHGGYEQFYKEEKKFCSPQGYRPMRHPDHEADLRQFRSKSKSWQGEKSRIGSCAARTNLMRLGF